MWWSYAKSVSNIPTRKVSLGARIIGTAVLTLSLVGSGFILNASLQAGEIAVASNSKDDTKSHLPSTDAIINQCGMIFSFHVKDNWYGTFNPEDLKKSPSGGIKIPISHVLVPPYGYMTEEPFNAGNKIHFMASDDITLPSILRAMYDGKTVLWYDPELVSSREIQQMTNYANQNDHVIVVEWTNKSLGIPNALKGYQIPEGRKFAFSSWGVTQSCDQFSEGVMTSFVEFSHKRNQSNPRPAQPHPAELTSEDKLPPIGR